MFWKTAFEKALKQGLASRDVPGALESLGDYPIQKIRDAEALCAALTALGSWGPGKTQFEAIQTLCMAMQHVKSREAFNLLRQRALPVLASLFVAGRDSEVADKDDLMSVLQIMGFFDYPNVIPLIVETLGQGILQDAWQWIMVFHAISEDSPLRIRICDELADSLPSGLAAVALLDFVNGMLGAEPKGVRPVRHPFDSPAGHAQLEAWLRDSDPEQFSKAHSATTALPFLEHGARERLLALAMDHPHHGVHLEAARTSARTSARLGSASGLRVLARFCTDVHKAHLACHYLEELGRQDAIPESAQSPDFRAMAAMSDWLQHPNELGEAPESIELLDTRELFWPPSRDRRRLWLFQYTYPEDKTDPGEEDDPRFDIGVGLVGGLTPWSFVAVTTPDWPVEDLYALHCSWEMTYAKNLTMEQQLGNAGKYSVKHGKRLLAKYNPPSR